MPCDSWYDVMDAAGNGASDQFSGLTDSLSEQHGQLSIKQLPQLRRSSSSGSGDALIPLDAEFHVLPSTGALAAMGMTTGAALQPRQLWSPPCEQTYSNRSSMDHHASRVSMDNHSSRSSMDIHNSRSSMDGPHSYARNSFEGPRQQPQRQSFDGPRAQRSRSSLDMQAPLLNFSSGSNASQQHRSAPSNVVNMEGGVGPSGQDQHQHESSQPGKAPSARKGQGYRRLWQAVTKVQRGQRLGDATSDWSECTVEDLVRILHALPASASAVQAAGPGLAYLDSRAAAALFKGLAKSGLGHRAVELFDYLRSLDEHNELAPLCDIYTYTTMISQCGSHHQLRRALELVAEMRGRAIALNVHTYSALLNVCLKSNELDLALDIREQMLAEGCMPNLVTFNTLCDIYGKTGRWADALAVLDTLQEQGIQPEVRTYNAIMAACNMSGRHAEAVSVYERLLSNGLEPGAATFNAAITAYTKSGQLDAALEMLALMGSKGFERGGAAYSAVLSACEAPGRWDLALELLAQMQREGVRPSTACFTSAINACLQGNQPQRAEQLFERMHTICKPDAATFNCLVVVYCRLGKVREAQNMVEVMMRAGQSVELPTYSAVICVLWCSGVVPLQRHALQLFDRACKQGLYRLQVREQTAHEDCVDIQLPCAPPHTTLIALTQLLRELRDRCARDGPALLKRRVVLRVPVQAKDAAVQERTLTAALQALGAPFTTSSNTCTTTSTSPRSTTNGSATPPTTHTTQMDELRLCAESQALGPWLAGPAPSLALGGLQSAPPEALVRLDGMALAQQDMARELRCRQAMGTVQAFEMGCFVDSQAMPQALLLQRSEGVQTMLAAANQLGIRREAAHDAVLLHDRVMSSGHLPQPDAAMGSLVAAACLAIAGQQAKPNDGQDLVAGVSHAMRVPLDALTMWVGHVRQLLGGNTASISALRVLRLYMERLGCESEDPSAIHCVCGAALSAMDRVVASPLFIGCPPSITATAVMYAARVAAGLLPAWPQALLSLVGYHCPSDLLQPYVDAAMQLLAMQQ